MAVQKALPHRLKVWKETQPCALAPAGYVWKNPPGDRAARLVETVGLRGKRVNGAEISSKAANLIVNRGGATHHDIPALLEMGRAAAAGRFGLNRRPPSSVGGLSPALP